MSTKLALHALEEGTYYITIATKDKDGTAQSPAVLNWTLSDMTGTTINSRSEVNIANPSSSEEVTLSGDDLAFQTGEIALEVMRVFTVKGTLSGNPLRGRVYFYIDNLEAI